MSRSKAIAEYCKGCIYDKSDDGTWRAQVSMCKDTSCALFPFRPLPFKKRVPDSSVIALKSIELATT